MYDEIASHLDTLGLITNQSLKQAYLALILAATASGLEIRQRKFGDTQELQFRDADGQQPCAAILEKDSLLFCLRRPLLDLQPGFAWAATQHFGSKVTSNPESTSEVRIKLTTLSDVEDMMAFLRLHPRLISLGYGARISA